MEQRNIDDRVHTYIGVFSLFLISIQINILEVSEVISFHITQGMPALLYTGNKMYSVISCVATDNTMTVGLDLCVKSFFIHFYFYLFSCMRRQLS